MSETASPDPTHADSKAVNGEKALDDSQPSHKHSEADPLLQAAEQDVNDSRELQELRQGTRHEPKTNGHDHDQDTTLDEPPAKRRRVREVTPPSANRRPKPESPPWKKIEANGPSSFSDGGRRKSGRINTVPLELQSGDKRITRRSFHSSQASPPKPKAASLTTRPSSNASPAPNSASKRPSSSGKTAPAKTAPAKPLTKKPPSHEAKPTPRFRGRSSSPKPRTSIPKPAAVGTRRSTRHARDADEADDNASPRALRIKLRVRPPLTTIPLVHRDQANARSKLGPSFEGYFERAWDIPVEQGGLLDPEDGPKYTDEMARGDAQTITRIEDEAEPGGLLAANQCSVFEPEAQDEPPRQWAHMDHVVKAAGNFRRLLIQEQQRHRAAARRLALACEAEWRRRNPQPKTAAEIEREEIDKSKARWRQVVKAVAGTWDNVKAQVNRQRLAEWEAEEQRRAKAALNQAVNLSEQKLQARQARLDTDELTDDLEDDDDLASDADSDEDMDSDVEIGSGSASEDNESNMSSSDDDEDKNSVLSDEGLTQAQLREKYADLPELQVPVDGGGADIDMNGRDESEDDDTSDESIDMDDDLGSTEVESGDDGSDNEAGGSEDDEPAGLLGLFFNKSELKKMKEDTAEPESQPESADTAAFDVADFPAPALLSNGHAKESEVSGDPKAASLDIIPGTAHQDRVGSTNGASNAEHPGPVLPEKHNNGDISPTSGKSTSAVDGVLGKARVQLPTDLPTTERYTASKTQEAAEGDVHQAEDVPMPDMDSTPMPEILDHNGPADRRPDAERLSPETDPVTNPRSPSRSQSPRTSDTKPSDLDTASSVEPLTTQKLDSLSATPAPGAPKTEIPFLLRGTLREYQHYGLDWLAGLYSNSTNGILADEMGLGKTIQTIALLAHLACHHEVWGPHLVIVPTSVMLNWEMEFKKWCPAFKILTYYGTQDERKRKRQGWTNDDVWNVCITSYQMVLQDNQVFRRRRWHYMILDEAHNIKNFKSKRWQTLLGFNTHSRLLLTGTPLQNNLTELWSLLYFLMPPENGEGGFADLPEFNNWFHAPESQILERGREQLDDESRAIIAKLHKVLRPYLLRRLKADVEKQMPAKYEHVEFCRLSKRQRELYDGFLSRSETRETLSSGNYMSIINCLMQLRKVCNHPDLFVDRPIMTSFRMQRSVPADFEIKEQAARKMLADKAMDVVSLEFLNMMPARFENLSSTTTDRIVQLSSPRVLLDLRETQKARANYAYTTLDPGTVKSNIVYLESAGRWGRFEELQHCVYLNALRRQQRPIYGKRLVDMLTLDTSRRPFKQRPKLPRLIMSWFEEDSFLLHNAIPTLEQRAASMDMTVSKFAFVTPAVVTSDMNKFLLGTEGVNSFEETNLKLAAPVKYAPYMPKEAPLDPWHEARLRLSIQFPDKRLLQYDCGKLQVLDKLLRKLQAGGHRALIFTQMTKVLNILELFLNIHGHKYLRLDGATKVEQRQILTDRFNHDTRILCFILSTRSGGLGINLTGADTVIFYDQDWNPAMDKQCQDRCHRIGQTRDVHIYRLVSEHTIEANILRKASQKQMLDDVVIQEGEFTTDYFNKLSVRDVIGNNGEVFANVDDLAANAAVDRVLGGADADQRGVGRVLEQAEDKEDVAAAHVAEKEIQQDDEDFLEQRPTPGAGSGVSSTRQGTPRDGTEPPSAGPLGPSALGLFADSAADGDVEEIEYNAYGERMHNIDAYMMLFMTVALKNAPLDLPRDKKRSKKKGKDTRKR